MTAPSSTHRPRLGRGWFSLASCLVWVLVTTLVAYVLNAGFSFWAWRTLRGWSRDPASIDPGLAGLYDAGVVSAAVVLTLLHLTVLVLFIVWLFRAHRSDRMEPAYLEHRSGWAIGGWFVPILNLWRPYQMVQDVRNAGTSRDEVPSPLALWWWLALLAGLVGDRVTKGLVGSQAGSADPVGALASANLSDAIVSVLWIVATLLAVLVVRGTTDLVRRSPHTTPA